MSFKKFPACGKVIYDVINCKPRKTLEDTFILVFDIQYSRNQGSFPVPTFQNTEPYVCFTCYYG